MFRICRFCCCLRPLEEDVLEEATKLYEEMTNYLKHLPAGIEVVEILKRLQYFHINDSHYKQIQSLWWDVFFYRGHDNGFLNIERIWNYIVQETMSYGKQKNNPRRVSWRRLGLLIVVCAIGATEFPMEQDTIQMALLWFLKSEDRKVMRWIIRGGGWPVGLRHVYSGDKIKFGSLWRIYRESDSFW